MFKAEKLKKYLFFALKFLLALGVAGILFSRGRQEMLQCLRSFDYCWLIPVIFIAYLSILFSSWRWQVLARVIGIKLTFFEALSLTMQGNFFSLVIPGGALGGDVVKMAVIGKRTPSGSRAEGVFTVFMDRVVGMISLFSLALIILWPARELLMKVHFGTFPAEENINLLLIAGCALLCLAGLGASFIIFFHRLFFKLPGVRFFVEKAEKFSRGSVSRMTGATDRYAGHWPLLAVLTVLTTVLVHLFAVVPSILLFRGLGVEFSLLTLVTAVVLGNIAGLIPFFPGGIGIRDLVTVSILSAGAIAPADAKTVQLIATAVMLLIYFSGGVFFILDPGRRNRQKGAGANHEQQ